MGSGEGLLSRGSAGIPSEKKIFLEKQQIGEDIGLGKVLKIMAVYHTLRLLLHCNVRDPITTRRPCIFKNIDHV